MKTTIKNAVTQIRFHRLADVPATYEDLVRNVWLPRPIHTKAACATATAVIDALAVFEKLNKDQLDYLDAVAHFVSEYEGAVLPRVTALQLLKSLVEDHHLTGAGLSAILGGSRMLGPMILRGERSITADHARALGAHFRLSPAAFL